MEISPTEKAAPTWAALLKNHGPDSNRSTPTISRIPRRADTGRRRRRDRKAITRELDRRLGDPYGGDDEFQRDVARETWRHFTGLSLFSELTRHILCEQAGALDRCTCTRCADMRGCAA
ncbi:hypothetical protein [Streptomyces silvisoli]|uniref:hypothetical protein n=1 Tax=Streptomyces silvisoli TaxID=3034235 RepID=UPI0023E0D411|nr:hypothetical protein [Streptomyces silvisoli]